MLIEKQSASDGSYVQCGVSWEGGNGAGLESRARTEEFVQEVSSAVGSGTQKNFILAEEECMEGQVACCGMMVSWEIVKSE